MCGETNANSDEQKRPDEQGQRACLECGEPGAEPNTRPVGLKTAKATKPNDAQRLAPARKQLPCQLDARLQRAEFR
jgi:hypothetical protein